MAANVVAGAVLTGLVGSSTVVTRLVLDTKTGSEMSLLFTDRFRPFPVPSCAEAAAAAEAAAIAAAAAAPEPPDPADEEGVRGVVAPLPVAGTRAGVELTANGTTGDGLGEFAALYAVFGASRFKCIGPPPCAEPGKGA